ncbi:enoyl-CoA hydratase-related protein [Rugosimonospora acidiphila]|uniref:Enoyl-CoA hydratase-related protein n=1 Tax=Rugosimonospora acidiphila TaxID=556531 RepID=A0ABP9SJU0_9ACTN
MSEHLRLEFDDRLATIVIDRGAKRNALSLDMWRAIPGHVERVRERGARVLIVRGGDDFSAGADISEFGTLRSGIDGARRYAEAVHAAGCALTTLEIPTIAAITGVCVGGGCEIALACDIRVAAADSRFGITPANLGIVYHFDSTRRLVEAVGPAWAKQILFSGDIFDAATALRVGLVNEVHPAAEVRDRAVTLARRIATRAAVSVRGAKTIVGRIVDGEPGDDPAVTALYDEATASAEYAEGVSAFMSGRPPRF